MCKEKTFELDYASSTYQRWERLSGLASDSHDDLFSGRGSPAYMSPKEPAIRLLKERYNESFALTFGSDGRIHLFLIKLGLWSLAYTFVFKESSKSELMGLAFDSILCALNGEDRELARRIDKGIEGAKRRIEERASKFKAEH